MRSNLFPGSTFRLCLSKESRLKALNEGVGRGCRAPKLRVGKNHFSYGLERGTCSGFSPCWIAMEADSHAQIFIIGRKHQLGIAIEILRPWRAPALPWRPYSLQGPLNLAFAILRLKRAQRRQERAFVAGHG